MQTLVARLEHLQTLEDKVADYDTKVSAIEEYAALK